jgi:hypothetical protein
MNDDPKVIAAVFEAFGITDGMRPLTHPWVAESYRTSIAFPDQYEGTLADGRHFYFRFRHGYVQLGIGSTADAAVDDTLRGGRAAGQALGDEYAGNFSSAEERDTVFATLLQRRLSNEENP